MSVPAFLIKLLHRKPLGSVSLGPEDIVCVEFANRLRAWTLEGRLNAIWCHVPNEVGGGGGRKSQIRYAIAKALGMIPGFPDYVFAWNGGAGFIEAKAPKGSQNENQKWFQSWCDLVGVPYALIKSADQGEAVLRQWGILS